LSIELILDIDPAIAAQSTVEAQDWHNWFGVWAHSLNPEILADGDYEVSLMLVDDAEIQTLNAQYRQLDCPTDVLAFAALEADVPEIPQDLIDAAIAENSDQPYVEPTYLGDLIISVTTALRQALEQKHSVRHELAWLAAHGLLHLLGWDHPDAESLEAMLAQQDLMLRSLHSANVFESAKSSA
jgi:probable rRNA maturation factor